MEQYNDELLKDMIEIIESSINYMNNELDIDVVIKLNPDSEYEAYMNDVTTCDDLDPCEFEICIRPSLMEEEHSVILTAIAHEMVHVVQHANGQLLVEDGTFVWIPEHGPITRIPFEGKDFSRSEYFAFPWEQQAYGLERALYENFREEQESNKNILSFLTELE